MQFGCRQFTPGVQRRWAGTGGDTEHITRQPRTEMTTEESRERAKMAKERERAAVWGNVRILKITTTTRIRHNE